MPTNPSAPQTRPGSREETRASDPVVWTKRRWFFTVAAVFLAQAGLIAYIEKPMQVDTKRPRFDARIHLVGDPLLQQTLQELPEQTDPTLFALPSHRGFSGQAWLQFQSPRHELKAWDEPRRWLTLNAQQFGKAFYALVETNAPPRLNDTPLPTSPLTGLEIYIPTESVRTQSLMRVEGPIARRTLLSPIALPSWPGGEILTNTVIHLLVDADGYTVTATPLQFCGLTRADDYALQQARDARFDRLAASSGSGGDLAWGRLVFDWHTLPTNAVPAALNPPPNEP